MADEQVRRRLAAILAADVVGYSRLMEQDESVTLAMLKTRRKEVLEPLLIRHQGRIFKLTGDGVLVEFGSAVNAIQCAVELQKGMAAANAGLSQSRQLVLRIGINLGDVMVDSDLYGDSVNIAARLEGIAEPGGILVSGTAFDQVKNKVNVGLRDLGTQTLKNIAEPVRVYRITDTPQVAVPKGITHKPSIAVLPFTNMSGDQEQQYFSDGITEDIITELSRFRSLLVIARNSSFQFRAAADVKQTARDLGVQYIAEGSVRRSSGRIRITAQLLDAATGNHVWAEHYDRDLQDVFAVQNEVAQAIAATIEGRMAASGAERSRRKPTTDLMAYDCFLQAREAIERRGDPDAAFLLFQRAIELDPHFAQANAWLAGVYLFRFLVDLRPETLNEGTKLARKAISLDEADALSHAILGHAYTIGGQLDLAGLHHTRAVFLNPMDVRITSHRALWLAVSGRGNEAVQCLDTDLQRDPFPPAWYWAFRGIAVFTSGRYEEAIEALSHLTTVYWFDNYYLAASYAHLGLVQQASACAAEILQARLDFALRHVGMTEHFKNPADLERLLDGLRKAGLPE